MRVETLVRVAGVPSKNSMTIGGEAARVIRPRKSRQRADIGNLSTGTKPTWSNGWLICILLSPIKKLRLLMKLCFLSKKVNDSFSVVILHRKITKKHYFSGFRI